MRRNTPDESPCLTSTQMNKYKCMLGTKQRSRIVPKNNSTSATSNVDLYIAVIYELSLFLIKIIL